MAKRKRREGRDAGAPCNVILQVGPLPSAEAERVRRIMCDACGIGEDKVRLQTLSEPAPAVRPGALQFRVSALEGRVQCRVAVPPKDLARFEDYTAAQAFAEAGRKAISAGKHLIIDLGRLSCWRTDAIVGPLVGLYRKLHEAGLKLAVVLPERSVGREVLNTTRLDRLVTVRDTRAAALASLMG